jgi:hypothetical protein
VGKVSAVFFSYSHRDRKSLDELLKYLGPLIRSLGLDITLWDDSMIPSGVDYRNEISRQIEGSLGVILLISQDFINSKFIADYELPPILAAVEQGQKTVFPIHILPSTYASTAIEKYQAVGDPAKPLAGMNRVERASALVEISRKIVGDLKKLSDAPRPRPIEPADDGVKTSAALAGIEALIEVMNSPAVLKNAAAFKAVFRLSQRQIEILGYFKALHDLLHTFQISCYDRLWSLIRKFNYNPEDPSLWDSDFDYDGSIVDTFVNLNAVTKQQKQIGKEAVPWVTTLDGNLRTLSAAVEKRSVAEINTAIGPIERVMSLQPILLNDRLVQAASQLPLQDLADALNNICDALEGEQLNPVKSQQFRDGATALCDLEESLTRLIENHGAWQELDREIRDVEKSVFQDVDRVAQYWPSIMAMTMPLCAEAGDPLTERLVKTIVRLDESVETGKSGDIQQHFLNYRNAANKCFYKVDSDLKGLCERLQSVGAPLATVWEMIQ